MSSIYDTYFLNECFSKEIIKNINDIIDLWEDSLSDDDYISSVTIFDECGHIEEDDGFINRNDLEIIFNKMYPLLLSGIRHNNNEYKLKLEIGIIGKYYCNKDIVDDEVVTSVRFKDESIYPIIRFKDRNDIRKANQPDLTTATKGYSKIVENKKGLTNERFMLVSLFKENEDENDRKYGLRINPCTSRERASVGRENPNG